MTSSWTERLTATYETVSIRCFYFQQNGTVIRPDLRDIVYTYGMKSIGNQEVWKWMLDKYRAESNAQEKAKLLRGLASIGEPWILAHLLELAKDETIIRSQDFFTVLKYMSYNKVGEPLVWDFMRSEWPYLVDRFTLVSTTNSTRGLHMWLHFTSSLFLKG